MLLMEEDGRMAVVEELWVGGGGRGGSWCKNSARLPRRELLEAHMQFTQNEYGLIRTVTYLVGDQERGGGRVCWWK